MPYSRSERPLLSDNLKTAFIVLILGILSFMIGTLLNGREHYHQTQAALVSNSVSSTNICIEMVEGNKVQDRWYNTMYDGHLFIVRWKLGGLTHHPDCLTCKDEQ